MTAYSWSADPLIDEAKQRMRRRRLLLAAALAGVVVLAAGLTLALRPAGSASTGAWVPRGVEEIDVRAPSLRALPISRHITAPSQVNRVVAWFNGLHRDPSTVRIHGMQLGCAGGPAESVMFTFRDASGNVLAKAYSAPGVASYCDPIQFAVGAHRANFLIDGTSPNFLIGRVKGTKSLIGRVERLLGVKFPFAGYLG